MSKKTGDRLWLLLAPALSVACNSRPAQEVQATGKPRAAIERAFPAAGVERVILRAAQAEGAKVVTDSKAALVTVSGEPSGGARGYHPADSNWKETPANAWGFDFVSERFGSTLVVSSKNELQYIHHGYLLENLRLVVPPGVRTVLTARKLSGEGAPDLSPPEP